MKSVSSQTPGPTQENGRELYDILVTFLSLLTQNTWHPDFRELRFIYTTVWGGFITAGCKGRVVHSRGANIHCKTVKAKSQSRKRESKPFFAALIPSRLLGL